MTETQGWDIGLGYDPRFCEVMMQPVCPHGEKGDVQRFPLSGLLRALKISQPELALATRDSHSPPSLDERTATESSICEAAIPADCSGLTVLDIGGYDGRYAALCLDRGAREATCLDSGQYAHYGWAQPEHHPGVLYVDGDFRKMPKPYDLVLFFNVIYHLQDPWAAVEHLRQITRKHLAICSLMIQDDQDNWRLCQPGEVNPEDDTVYWVPSESALAKLLHLGGFTGINRVGKARDRVAFTAQ